MALGLVGGCPVSESERDGLWAISTGEVHSLLTSHAGWSTERDESWLADTVVRLLGPEPPPRPRRRQAQRGRTSNGT